MLWRRDVEGQRGCGGTEGLWRDRGAVEGTGRCRNRGVVEGQRGCGGTEGLWRDRGV